MQIDSGRGNRQWKWKYTVEREIDSGKGKRQVKGMGGMEVNVLEAEGLDGDQEVWAVWALTRKDSKGIKKERVYGNLRER